MDGIDARNSTNTLWVTDAFAYLPPLASAVLLLLFRLVESLGHFLNERWVQETVKMMLLGTIMQFMTGAWQTMSAKVLQRLYVEARIENGDFAWDWVDDYLNAHDIWRRAPAYRVITRSKGAARGVEDSDTREKSDIDFHPRPIYQSTPDQPEFWRWNGHWIKVLKEHGKFDYNTGAETGGVIILSVYSWKRWVLDKLINDARERYINVSRPRLITYTAGKSPSLITAIFMQPDLAYEWMLSFLGSLGAFEDVRYVHVASKTSTSTEWGIKMDHSAAEQVSFSPASGAPQLIRWNKVWLQVMRDTGTSSTTHYRTGLPEESGRISVLLHHASHEVLGDLVEAARLHWADGAQHQIRIHLSDSHAWDRVMKKARRSLDSVILPEGVREMLLADTRNFLKSAKWYKTAGVPYRRGYLLHGIPGSGKSSTIHALASELLLPIYSLSLATRGLSDSSLQRLISQTPPNCILTLEDIDCAFPRARGDSDFEDDDPVDVENDLMNRPTSEVTLSGLLNAIDGVWSEEGRLLFATTNHIECLDAALIRPGRLDVKVSYDASTRDQARRMFLRFFPAGSYCAVASRPSGNTPAGPLTSEQPREMVFMDDDRLRGLSDVFATSIPDALFSAAALQGYLLLWKDDPLGAVAGVPELVQSREAEKAAREDARQKAKAARLKARAERAEQMRANVNVVMQPAQMLAGGIHSPE
ncbi:P-loop containing nucleoside triphosphate hydrolase protein [Exidia glandulosa HHB12029]|uniref:p-loop containing nucleoside triphosphate hydrolase protein n=1 Tax=Exidia glandulosa HHB12029 TaxID=1314781 RepID=A0A165FCJ4_EXIGL|nr:P-loop containing nucleoside triphosphate hydrolase protein [Exidia glandulosa HHB12029]